MSIRSWRTSESNSEIRVSKATDTESEREERKKENEKRNVYSEARVARTISTVSSYAVLQCLPACGDEMRVADRMRFVSDWCVPSSPPSAAIDGYNMKKYTWKLLYMYMLGYDIEMSDARAETRVGDSAGWSTWLCG